MGEISDWAELELKKKRLLEELESALAPADKKTETAQKPLAVGRGRIEVIDETALLDSVANNNKQPCSRRRPPKNLTNRRTDHPKPSQPRPRPKNAYSRKDLEALRFVNMAQQRNFWKAIHAAFQTSVADEYNTLAPNPLPHNKPILSALCCENAVSELQNMESWGKVTAVGPACSPNVMGEDKCSNLEECGEDDDSDDDYASIQRPAFAVDGEPNFDSGPPEDGWEYLRRVRWEANQIPKVKVAKLDRAKLNKEQSAYMPKIPDIAMCPEHLLPLKQWEDVFLAEFSALRTNLSSLDVSNAICSGNLHVHSSQLAGIDCGQLFDVNGGILPNNHMRIVKTNDQQPTDLTAEDKDRILSPVNSESKTSVGKTSSNIPTPPLLSVILAMDSVARLSTLVKRISLLEAADTVTRNDCMWLFSLCATIDSPLDADTCAALRSLLRKCASIRAGKVELDEEIAMLNILATISGKYFGQSGN